MEELRKFLLLLRLIGCLPLQNDAHTRAAGVREASKEETAGQVHAVAPRAMGKVALAGMS
jgi:hypothetical protein